MFIQKFKLPCLDIREMETLLKYIRIEFTAG